MTRAKRSVRTSAARVLAPQCMERLTCRFLCAISYIPSHSLFSSLQTVVWTQDFEEASVAGKETHLLLCYWKRSSVLYLAQSFHPTMRSSHGHILLPILLSLTFRIVLAQQIPQQIPAPNYDKGWCYYCSDDDAPPLCNAQCTIAIGSLCSQDLTQSQIVTEQNCTLQYKPPVNPKFNDNGAVPPSPTADQCSTTFNNILASCGRDAGSPESATVNASYCTTSGGGGTYGWNDDGSVMTDGLGRYIVSTTNTDQCGQSQASWHQATSVILWNDSWIPDDATVTINTNPAPLAGSAASIATALPTLNPECATEVCDIYQHPYYATEPVPPWAEGGKDSLRHRVVFEGWSNDSGSTRLFNSLEDRCGKNPGNFQYYANGTQSIADFDLPQDRCWCVSDAIFDASGGIQLPNDVSCPSGTTVSPAHNVNRIELRHLKERGLKVRDPRRVVKKDWTSEAGSY